MSAQNDLLLFKVIQDWADYTLIILEKLPKKYNFTLKDHIFSLVLAVIQKADEANQIKVSSDAERTKRIALQNQILANLTSIDRMLQLAVRQKSISPKQLVSWGRHALNVRNLTLAWIKSDNKRYAVFRRPTDSSVQKISRPPKVLSGKGTANAGSSNNA